MRLWAPQNCTPRVSAPSTTRLVPVMKLAAGLARNTAARAISSVSGREIDFAAGPYGTFKAAIIHYTQGLAYQLAGKGIRANTVSPGNTYFDGGVWQNIEQGNPELFSQAMALNPTGRMAKPDEIARGVAFLASPAASFVTGANLVIDGALTRGAGVGGDAA